MKTITILKSWDLKNGRKMQVHSNKASDVGNLLGKETRITVDENETIWFTFYWWKTRRYTYDDFENEGVYMLKPILSNLLAVAITCFAAIVYVVCRNYTSLTWLSYIMIAVGMLVFILNMGLFNTMYLKRQMD